MARIAHGVEEDTCSNAVGVGSVSMQVLFGDLVDFLGKGSDVMVDVIVGDESDATLFVAVAANGRAVVEVTMKA